jgi:hypothetical protein
MGKKGRRLCGRKSTGGGGRRSGGGDGGGWSQKADATAPRVAIRRTRPSREGGVMGKMRRTAMRVILFEDKIKKSSSSRKTKSTRKTSNLSYSAHKELCSLRH